MKKGTFAGSSRACTFFGHRDASAALYSDIKSAIEKLIIENEVDLFYVGNNGAFDAMATRALAELALKYTDISGVVVLAYADSRRIPSYCLPTLFPDGIECVPPRFAIEYRNHWMISRSAFVIAYVTHITGSAGRFMEIAARQGRNIVRIGV